MLENIVIHQAAPPIRGGRLRAAGSGELARGPWHTHVEDRLNSRPDCITRDVAAGSFWLARVGDAVAGCVRFDLEDKRFWPDIASGESAFIHRLAVRRTYAGGVVSSAILRWAPATRRRVGSPLAPARYRRPNAPPSAACTNASASVSTVTARSARITWPGTKSPLTRQLPPHPPRPQFP